MKLKETPSYTPHSIDIEANYDEIGNDHVAGSVDTPLRSDAFDISEKKKNISGHLNHKNYILKKGNIQDKDFLKKTFTLLCVCNLKLNLNLKYFLTKKYKKNNCNNPATVTP